MLKEIPCYPEVYRRAAEIVCSAQKDTDQYYTCLAINDAVNEFFSKMRGCDRIEIQEFYKAQYTAAFGCRLDDPEDPVTVLGERGYWRVEGGTWCESHPFWNRNVSPQRQQIRATALLLMADICELGFN